MEVDVERVSNDKKKQGSEVEEVRDKRKRNGYTEEGRDETQRKGYSGVGVAIQTI